jgi:hypothetical protein
VKLRQYVITIKTPPDADDLSDSGGRELERLLDEVLDVFRDDGHVIELRETDVYIPEPIDMNKLRVEHICSPECPCRY